MIEHEYDYVIIGSGFGGSVSALRLSEKGYKVLVIEKGKWFKSSDFPKTNWNLRKWLWLPQLRLFGFFKMTFLNHVSVLSGVGVGGGSLTYANTLPVPKSEFFNSGSWAELNNWEEELAPHYKTAHKMLGAEVNPHLFAADMAVKELATDLGKEKHFEPTKVAVHFGEPGKTVSDPYFDGIGPDRTGCIHCGACMTGCRHNAKNTLDKNYLYLAQQLGSEIIAEKEVKDIRPIGKPDGSDGYLISYQSSIGRRKKGQVTCKGVVFSGGVLGSIPLMLELRDTSLPRLSNRVGTSVRTNNESLMIVTSTKDDQKDYTEGIAIGSILHTDNNSHLEPVRYGRGSAFFRLLTMPLFDHKSVVMRLLSVFFLMIQSPLKWIKTAFTQRYSKRSTILLFMQTLDSTLQIKRGKLTRMMSISERGEKPTAFIPEAMTLGQQFGKKVKGIPYGNIADVLRGTPTTAHILGGNVMGQTSEEGVIDKNCRVFGYQNMMVCDGSMISANPGVNPSLSITAITEYAMSKVPAKAKN